jgi:hypothetical protein
MSLRSARIYRIFSRTVLPLWVLAAVGSTTGFLLFELTGHLGFPSGPLGQLRKDMRGGTGSTMPGPQHGSAVFLLVLVMWVGVLAIELRHLGLLRLRRLHRPQLLLLSGYCLGALQAIVAFLPPPAFDTLDGSLLWLAGVVILAVKATTLTLGAWPSWGFRTRLAAPLICVTFILAVLSSLRIQERHPWLVP